MSTLLLRLAAPLQSWGTDSKFETRRTGREPSKSGVIGLLAAALGIKRDESLERLNALRFGVRVDQEGKLLRDFHTARKDEKTSYVTARYYLSDAVFVAAFESDDESFLKTLDNALKNPVYPLFLGRRSCPPTLPLSLGLRPLPLLEALRAEPWQTALWRQKQLDPELKIIADVSSGEMGNALYEDVPVSFSPLHRQFSYRMVAEYGSVKKIITDQDHDPMAELG